MNYAELNPKLNYNKNNSNFENTANFSKYQTDMPNDNYYCGGNSTLALRGMQVANDELSLMYFSQENIDRIQRHIKSEVRRLSNGKYKLDVDQDEFDLLIIMRAVFLEHAKHIPTHIVRQVKELNKQTIDYLIPDVMTNIKQSIGYLRDITTPLQPLDHPLNVNRGGRKTLPSFTSTWGV